MKVRMKQQGEGRKSAEENEREGRNKFLEDWKMKVARKKEAGNSTKRLERE